MLVTLTLADRTVNVFKPCPMGCFTFPYYFDLVFSPLILD